MRALTSAFLAVTMIATLIFPIAVSAGNSVCDTIKEIPPAECLALENLYISTNGNSWTNRSYWLNSPTPSEWYGILVQYGHVTELLLNENNLTGSIPDVFNNLPYLTRIELGYNQLTGTIPSSISSLNSLVHFQVVNNSLTGEIPAFFGSLSNLQSLLLSGNQFSGAIPPVLGNLTKLNDLRLNGNNLSGSLPDALGNLSQLVILKVGNNPLTGSIPLSYTKLSVLNEFVFSFTDLCEPLDPEFIAWKANFFPSSIWDGTDKICQEEYCKFHAEIPGQECQALVSLYFDTYGNDWVNNSKWLSTTDKIEEWYGIYTFDGQVVEIHLSNNNLTGLIPAYLDDLTKLERLYLYDNNLSGNIPAELGNLSNLKEILLNSNQLTGEIPEELSQLTGLKKLGISDNQLSGKIPYELGLLVNLEHLYISQNNLSGLLPMSFINLTFLDFFVFEETDLCELTTSEFVTWKSTVNNWFGTGILCKNCYLPLISH